MNFSQADENVLTTLFGKEVVDKLSGALKSDDGELSIGAKINGRVITTEDETILKSKAELQGKELRSKELAKALNITLDAGEKDPVKMAEKFTNTITSILEDKYKNPEPGAIEKELELKLSNANSKYDALFNTHNETLKVVDEKENAYKALRTENVQKERNNTILSLFPEKMTQDRKDALIITNSTFEFDEMDGKQVIKRDNEIIRNGAGEPETYDNIIKSFVEEKKWIKVDGMGGGDRGNLGEKTGLTAEQAEQAIIKAGEDPGSTKGLAMFNQMTVE